MRTPPWRSQNPSMPRIMTDLIGIFLAWPIIGMGCKCRISGIFRVAEPLPAFAPYGGVCSSANQLRRLTTAFSL